MHASSEALIPMGSNDAPAAPVVFVVDDDISVRESLEMLFRCAGLQTTLFASAEAFLASPRPTGPGCLVLDVSLPDINGLDLQQRIAPERGDLPIIFITGHGDVPMTVKAMKAGAVEFLLKPFHDEALLNAVHDAIERSRAALARAAEVRTIRARHATLTRRERDVLHWVIAGRLNKQIAGELGISEITVKAHRRRVMEKMHARSVPDLVRIEAKLRP
ncbi:DNA-binding response regulator [Dyella solisilvae]|uniref:DNA-binding response regulator n=1 Tax=Dyella solisilvae TaxID=1920168 RepID=A0A370K5U5_9GAMM|nr:response regulator [Dyella solisilvae]RDI98022.1 DNA-binding response regulator [Dyella solisilvae]